MSSSTKFLSPRIKLPLHLVQLFLISVAVGLSAPRLFMKGQPRTRANTIALGMGAKSIIIIQYQLLTEHVKRFYRWRSLKAFAILNGLEIVFWAAVVFLVIQANISICVGVGCVLSWIVVGVAIVLTTLAVYAFAISYTEFRASRGRRSSARIEYDQMTSLNGMQRRDLTKSSDVSGRSDKDSRMEEQGM